MPMDLKAFAREVHQNAVEHGFWEGERPIEETFALIHSEWSEALEEYRAGRPMHYYNADFICKTCSNCHAMKCENCEADHCAYGKKPEGIAVELVDGCIRIMDFLEMVKMEPRKYSWIDSAYKFFIKEFPSEKYTISLPMLVCTLHKNTTFSLNERDYYEDFDTSAKMLLESIAIVKMYLRDKALDINALMREKHEYNRTRPYMHGKKC